MKFDFLDRRSAERFAELLDETRADRRHHTRGQADEHLAELVAIGHSLSAARPGAQVDPEFRMGLRAMLVATAERDGIGATASAPGTEREAGASAGQLLGRTGRRIRARGAIVIGVAAGAMAVSGISAASENASPGDALYHVKLSTERAQLAMAGSDITRGQLSLTFARNRLAEATMMDGGNAKFGGALDDMDADTRQGVRLLISSAVTRADPAGLNPIDTFVDSQLGLLTPALERLDQGNRERALRSMSLLDTVSERADSIRDGLACDANLDKDGPDALGPRMEPCRTGSGSNSEQGGRHQGASSNGGDKPDSGKSDDSPETATKTPATDAPTAEPDPTATTDDTDRTGQGSTVTSTTSPAATVSSTRKNDGTAQDVEPSQDPEPNAVTSEDPVNPPADEDKGLLGGLLGDIFGKG